MAIYPKTLMKSILKDIDIHDSQQWMKIFHNINSIKTEANSDLKKSIDTFDGVWGFYEMDEEYYDALYTLAFCSGFEQEIRPFILSFTKNRTETTNFLADMGRALLFNYMEHMTRYQSYTSNVSRGKIYAEKCALDAFRVLIDIINYELPKEDRMY